METYQVFIFQISDGTQRLLPFVKKDDSTIRASKSLKSTPCSVYIPKSYSWILVILQPLTRINTLRRSCFTKHRAPLEAWIGGYISSCQCHQSSMLNKQRWCENLWRFSRWPIDDGLICLEIFSEAFFTLTNASNWSSASTKTIGFNLNFNLINWAYDTQVRFGRYAVFREVVS